VELLLEVSETIAASPPAFSSSQDLDDYKSFLRVLDWKIRNIEILNIGDESAESSTITELYRQALLVYINRISGDLLGQSARTQQQIEQGFDSISKLTCCERQFPVFIFGCEARTDEQRAIIQDVIARTEVKYSSRSLAHVKSLINACWVQDDFAKNTLSYWDKLRLVIGSCSILPSLV
jgi:hypothetical protein